MDCNCSLCGRPALCRLGLLGSELKASPKPERARLHLIGGRNLIARFAARPD
jgi:hypothetical protein